MLDSPDDGWVGLKVREMSDEQTRAYRRDHGRVHRARGRARDQICECGVPAREWAYQHGSDPEQTSSYRAMCKPCHAAYDDIGDLVAAANKGNSHARGRKNTPEQTEVMRRSHTGLKQSETTKAKRKRGVDGKWISTAGSIL